VTIETHHGSPMMGYLVSGAVEKNLEGIELNPSTLFEIPPQTNFVNASDEALTIFDGKIYTFLKIMERRKIHNLWRMFLI